MEQDPSHGSPFWHAQDPLQKRSLLRSKPTACPGLRSLSDHLIQVQAHEAAAFPRSLLDLTQLILERKKRETVHVDDATDVTLRGANDNWGRFSSHQAALLELFGKLFFPSTRRVTNTIQPPSESSAPTWRVRRHLHVSVFLWLDDSVQMRLLYSMNINFGRWSRPSFITKG